MWAMTWSQSHVLEPITWPGANHMTWRQSHVLEPITWPGDNHMTWRQPHVLETITWPGDNHVTWSLSHDLEPITWSEASDMNRSQITQPFWLICYLCINSFMDNGSLGINKSSLPHTNNTNAMWNIDKLAFNYSTGIHNQWIWLVGDI